MIRLFTLAVGLDEKTNYLLLLRLKDHLDQAREKNTPKYLILKGPLSKQSLPGEVQTIYVNQITQFGN